MTVEILIAGRKYILIDHVLLKVRSNGPVLLVVVVFIVVLLLAGEREPRLRRPRLVWLEVFNISGRSLLLGSASFLVTKESGGLQCMSDRRRISPRT